MGRPKREHNPIDDLDDVPRIEPSDPFSPPLDACECYCLHCGRTFMSEDIWLQRYRVPPEDGAIGLWMCPTPNCDGKGFTFDIFPTDPSHPCNSNWSADDDEYLDEEGLFGDEALFGDADDTLLGDRFDDVELADDEDPLGIDSACDEAGDYDPAEPHFRAMDEDLAASGDDEGEEWKRGLQPGEYALDFMNAAGIRPMGCDDPRYDRPDERPREIDYVEPDLRFNEDDIPF